MGEVTEVDMLVCVQVRRVLRLFQRMQQYVSQAEKVFFLPAKDVREKI